MKLKKTMVSFTPKQRSNLDNLCKEKQISLSEMLRRILDEYFDKRRKLK